jgi:hypothetical protein
VVHHLHHAADWPHDNRTRQRSCFLPLRGAAESGPTRKAGFRMATDSAIASLPHALISAYKTLAGQLQGKDWPHNVGASCEAICGFVRQWRQIPAWREELERRATFLERSSGEGSPWEQAACNAVKFLRDRKKTDDPLEDAWRGAGVTTIQSLRCVANIHTVRTRRLRKKSGVLRENPGVSVVFQAKWHSGEGR